MMQIKEHLNIRSSGTSLLSKRLNLIDTEKQSESLHNSNLSFNEFFSGGKIESDEKQERSRNVNIGKVIGSFKEHVKWPKNGRKKVS